MNSERDKFLTEAMGESWFCYKATCGIEQFSNGDTKWINTTRTTNDFSTWGGFGKLFKWVRSTGNYDLEQSLQEISRQDADCFFMIDPDKLADFVYEYLKENDK